MNPETSRLRLAVVGVVVLSLFASLFARLWYLQVLDARTFVAAASSNQVRFVYEEAPRGRILDRQGRPLVANRGSQAVTVDRNALAQLDDPEAVKTRLAALLAIDLPELDRRLGDVRYSHYKPVPVAEDVSEETVIYLREHADDFPAVRAEVLPLRAYPGGDLAAHVLGYVGEITDKELERRRGRGYRLGDSIGKSGVELTYEGVLRGEPGVTKLQADALGRVLGDPLATRAPVPGSDVQLTLDADIQRLAQDSLAQGIEAARGSVDRNDRKPFVAPAGAVVVLDPRDGGVLAMGSFPTYNPADFVAGIRPEVFAALSDPASHYPLNNRAITGQYAPGSTFKHVTAIAGLRHGLVAPGTTIVDQGVYKVPNCRGEKCTFRNAGSRRYGRVDLRRALTVSSDVYFYELGARVWLDRSRYGTAIQDVAREMGFGRRTGIALPTEKAGRVPDPESRKKLNEANPKAFPEGRWFTGDNINLAIGQGEMAVTPLQLAVSYAALANGGTVLEPRIAARVLDGDGNAVREEAPKTIANVDLPAPMRQALVDGLVGVVAREEGTAAGAFAGFPIRDFPVAAKTGTAQVRGKQDTALFVAFAPANDPQYVVAVVMEEAGFGGSAAAPVARRILEGIAGQPPGPVRLGTGTD